VVINAKAAAHIDGNSVGDACSLYSVLYLIDETGEVGTCARNGDPPRSGGRVLPLEPRSGGEVFHGNVRF
ncbi:MAG: hypothetical protein IKG89_06480, partial [Oscillospiraceae bacterium]|nr:hypothetical protein [Oscillospiraceae bacterium]